MGSLSLFHHHVSRSLPQRFQVLVLLVSLPIFDRLPSRVISVSYVESTGNLLRTSSRSLPQRFQVLVLLVSFPIFDRLPSRVISVSYVESTGNLLRTSSRFLTGPHRQRHCPRTDGRSGRQRPYCYEVGC
jgi:hypothetical protein